MSVVSITDMVRGMRDTRAAALPALVLAVLAGGLYLSLSLGIWSQFKEWSLLVACVPLLATFIAFTLRKNK